MTDGQIFRDWMQGTFTLATYSEHKSWEDLNGDRRYQNHRSIGLREGDERKNIALNSSNLIPDESDGCSWTEHDARVSV
jgi:hypothetical protein